MYVVDASVAVKWFLPEPLADLADGILTLLRSGAAHLIAPDLIIAELGNALLRRVRSSELQPHEPNEMLEQFLELSMDLQPMRMLATAASDIGVRAKCSFYDSLYAATAQDSGVPLVTADDELIRLLRRAGLGHLVIPLSDLDTSNP